ncbi:helix-hairpin-helix domain-containing protein [Lutibacter sp.]|uniref:helix-hairpin-helix domain-containing protein n=1 Tax=Lutibacter sp. TaxID=1925666 RepID=UPI0025C6C705|nr:helix-hairpin-helix domain-containing protein [Lutibacter sp.]MCF6182977.1 helix-hairpin-helix domain-containing protein [Lutibacter sp.]
MSFFKSHFNYNKGQRNGIFGLIIIIVSLQLILHFVNFSSNKLSSNLSEAELKSFSKEMDSLQNDKLKKKSKKIYPFNPNYITDFKGYQLGLSVKEIDNLLAYRKQGKFVNSSKEFQNVTEVSDSLLKAISPYFKFPNWVTKRNVLSKINYTTKAKNVVIKDINTATISDFKKVSGIGNKLAERIIKYRNKLQGFSFNSQLYEVWYLDKDVADRALKRFQVIKKPNISKIDINEATAKQLYNNVYINYNLAKIILSYRDEVAEIQSIEELKKIDSFPLDKFNLIALYLRAN